MGSRAAVCQILRWSVRNASFSSLFSPRRPWRCFLHLPPTVDSSRVVFSSSSHGIPSQIKPDLPPQTGSNVPELSLLSLADLGFTDSQAEQILDTVSSLKKGSKNVLSTLTVLFVLGLNANSVVKLQQKCPELYSISEAQLQQRIAHLRKLGLMEGSLQRTVSHYPRILTVPVKTLKHVVLFLRENCLFTTQQIADILRESPAVVLEDLQQLEYKFQYVYFRMGIKQAEMVKFRLFRFALDELRCRHVFLERRGFYQTPDKKGQTVIVNPKLDAILQPDLETFLSGVARASAEEYQVFQKLLAREWQEEEFQPGRIEPDEDDDKGEDDDDDEDEEMTGKSGYKKKRKR